jgi:cation diffusion facilitator CzcD-associated flavoprotein CzcO
MMIDWAVEDDARVRESACGWLDSFATALDARATDLVELFVAESYWRDVLAFTWDLRTFYGAEALARALEDCVEVTAPRVFELSDSVPPRYVVRAGRPVLEAFFTFETAVGTAHGVVRLLEDGLLPPRAWTLMTFLHDMRGMERPKSRSYQRNFGGDNWLDQRRASVAYRDREPTVLIVGGGQAGLSLAARLGQLDVDALIVDRMERVGDNWRNRYHSLTLHNEVWANHLPYLPFPATWPVYLPKDKVANWFEFYVDAMELNFWTSTEFVNATYDTASGTWTAKLQQGDQTRLVHPRHIVMATGQSGIPNAPVLQGIEDFKGTVIHSHGFRDGSAFTGRRALVIGTGNSGHDVAQDLHSHGAEVTLVQRSPTTVASVEPSASIAYSTYTEFPDTETADLLVISVPYPLQVLSNQITTKRMVELDADLLAGLHAAGFETDIGPDGTGFQMKFWRRGGGYYLNVGCSELIADGEIGLIQFSDIESFTETGVRLRDGSDLPVAIVILATGYKGMQELVRRCFGNDVADRVGQVWGLDHEGEQRNMWKRTPQEGLWFMAGGFAHCRIYSRPLALQIKACEEKLITKQKQLLPAQGAAPLDELPAMSIAEPDGGLDVDVAR